MDKVQKPSNPDNKSVYYGSTWYIYSYNIDTSQHNYDKYVSFVFGGSHIL
jgi:hypothetical protein